jgi:hypothetical protein
MARRPCEKALLGPGKKHKDSHMCLAGGSVDVECTVGAEAFIEGSQVTFEARVRNHMERAIMTGKLELEEHIESTLHNTSDRGGSHWGDRAHARDLVVSKLRGLQIPGKSDKVIKFALDLPRIVEPPSTGFGKSHHKLKVRHVLQLQLDVPWGRDIRMSFPVTIAPNPERYWVPNAPPATPTFVPVAADAVAVNELPNLVSMETVEVPEGYATIAVDAVPAYEPWHDPRPKFLAVELVSGHKLPKMDFTFGGLRGAADPYVTVWVNDTHVRTSKIVHNTVEPVFKEVFRFLLTEKDLGEKLSFRFNCYDYDSTSSDDLIGNGDYEFGSDQVEDLVGKSITVDLSREIKGKVKQRGQLEFKLVACAPL